MLEKLVQTNTLIPLIPGFFMKGVVCIMPLTFSSTGSVVSIKAIKGKDDVRNFLASLGFVVGSPVSVISEANGNLIVNVKDTRIAISKSMANRIMV